MTPTDFAIAILIFALYNVIVFCTFWWDKDAARNGEWRISESTLLGLAFLGGTPGAVIGQRVLRHKTRKEPFRSILRAICITHGVCLVVALLLLICPDAARLLAVALSSLV
ncbi:DUF1294 domain-containing protein [Ciceribacter sp. L1K22]|uniref:DUF1294 domain-containing protein n=1 Tax=Ciceribacter sp. L1K22 TaxID=2820275 RepID=UPI001ABE9574|nr:DUF1294 domain-containing protein [Ciceribacter sp. L1K22]MBO3759881.1 DUF1294 domain-containing protein [Ciceribacter sp. L1K22]